jgi:phage major head subunit gpT-like protein
MQLTADFTIKAVEGEAPASPTFELVAYTGRAIRQSWSRNPIVVDLAGMDTSRQAVPILWGHDASLDSVLGQSSSVTNDGQALTLAGEIIGEGPVADRVLSLSRKGLRLQASIGADAGRIENIAPGESVTVNGREFTGPVSVVRASSLREVSIVLFGADANTSAAIAADANEGANMAESANDTPVEATVPQTEAPAIVAVESPAVEKIDVEAVKAEAIKVAREAVLAEIRAARPAAPAVHVVERIDGPAVVEASLCLAGGLPDVEKRFDQRTLEAAGKNRGVSLGEVLIQAARSNGYDGGNRITHSNLRTIMATAFATHAISNVLAATYGKFLLAGFNAVEATWDAISSVRSVSDFKAVTGVRLNGGFEYEEVANGGELKSADASDEKRTIQAKTYGRLTSVTRQDIINDDLGALSAVPQRLGRGAAIKLNKVFWAEFESSNSTFFAKETAGAGNALQLSSLKTAASSYRKLQDPDGNPLGIAPSILLVPPELEIAAAELMSGSLLITGENATRTNANVLAGRYQVVSSSYLTSGSTWWLCANPADLPAMEVAFLNGQRQPTVEQAEADFNTLGIMMRGYFDFGVAKAEKNAAYRMATA